jgi:UDP-N-acetylglucosamine--N-acetylmuramyl-(pentapeptide) pyrophosphoryl-undecaprenol N-acetylglucosamine transferase
MLAAPLKVTAAVRQSIALIKKINPDVVIGMGGFVSGPGGVACWLTGRPLLIHEQNARPGMTNKILSRISRRILAGFPSAFKSHAKVIDIGNPVRADIASLPPPQERLRPAHLPLRLLVLGGSLGAQALNDVVPRALARLKPEERPEVLHQTGDKHFDQAKKSYESMQIKADLQPFIHDMANAYAWADMVLCRAGALTVAELCAVGLGAVLVPFPHAVDDHQTANAQFMVHNRAALCIQQTELTEARLADIVKEFTKSPEWRLAMAQAAYQLRKVNVAEKIYQICQEVCR